MPLSIKDYALLAQGAYSSIPDIGQSDSAARVCFNQSEYGLILAIPGTNNGSCVLADIDIETIDTGECGNCFKGIWLAFDRIWHEVSSLDVYALVGHSEGAAGALFLGARLCLAGKAPKVIYALESPRASIDSKLSDIFTKYNVEVHILRHGLDIVTDLPIALPGMPWRHARILESFGNASLPFPNVHDHLIDGIIADL